MRVLLAPDKFGGTLTAVEVCDAASAGWHDVAPKDVVHAQPMSDGGPGFVGALAAAFGGNASVVSVPTTGPHGEPVAAQIVLVAAEKTAYLEAAQICGLEISDRPLRATDATTSGLVPLLHAALDRDVERVVVGVGGTASTDGGRPVVEAFEGTWPAAVELVVATDVENPLLGPAGAARSFAPQKGASDAEVTALEHRLVAWASGADVDPNAPGAGAGGGLGYGLMRLGARRVSGAALVAEAVELDATISAADIVVTGEGQLDFSSLRGKVAAFVAERAMAASTPCVALAGASTLGRREASANGFDEIYAMADLLGAEDAVDHAAASVRRVAGRIARDWARPH
jgi:glycerate kinase